MAWNQVATLTGPQGPTGATGSAGATGAQGIQGIQGIQGPQGVPGSTTIRGATDYDDAAAPTDRQAILWVASGSKFKPQTIQLADVSGLVTALDGKQPLDADLTTIAGLTVVNDSVMQGKAGAWAVRTPAQLKTDLVLVKADVGLGSVDNTADTGKPVSTAQQAALDGKQPLDADLTTIAGLTATTDNFLQAKASAWASRTIAQVKTDLAINNVDNTSNATERTATATLSGKRITPRVDTVASASTVTPTGDASDLYTVTALAAAATIAAPSGTPVNGQKLLLRIKDNGTARALTWNAIYRIVGVTLPTTTVISKTTYVGCIYNSADTKWDVIAVATEA